MSELAWIINRLDLLKNYGRNITISPADRDIIIEKLLQPDIVRCGECKHCQNLPYGLCYLHTEPYGNERGYKGEAVCVEADGFCSYGERRTP